MFFAIPRAQSWEVVLVNCGHGVTNDASNQDDIIPVFQEGAISGVVRATCSGGLGDFFQRFSVSPKFSIMAATMSLSFSASKVDRSKEC